jgi:hypothetical protein
MTAAQRQLFWCAAALDPSPTPTSRLLAPAPRLEAVVSPCPSRKPPITTPNGGPYKKGYSFNAIF